MADVPDNRRQLERDRIHLLLIDDFRKGLEDVAAGRTEDARKGIEALIRARRD